MKEKKWIQKLCDAFGRYKYVLLVALVGVILLTWPSGESAQAESPAPGIEEDLFQVSRMEEKLKRALSQVEGAGEVTVVLTLRESPRQVLAQDGEGSEETSTVLLSKGSAGQEPAVLQELGPVYQGALVVAQGGGEPRVRLALSEAVSALTGLGADKIMICKGK